MGVSRDTGQHSTVPLVALAVHRQLACSMCVSLCDMRYDRVSAEEDMTGPMIQENVIMCEVHKPLACAHGWRTCNMCDE